MADNNIAAGINPLSVVTSGTDNVAIGSQALTATTTGSQNVAIGGNAGRVNIDSGNNNIVIGYNQDVPASGTSNYLNIGGVITGSSSTGDITISGAVAASNLIGTNTGDQTIALTGDVTGSGTGSFVTTIKNDVALAGNPTTTTQAPGNNTTRIATTAFVTNAIGGTPSMFKLYSGSMVATAYPGTTIDFQPTSIEYPVPYDTYTQLELRLSNIVSDAPDTAGSNLMTVLFANQGTPETGDHYASSAGPGVLGYVNFSYSYMFIHTGFPTGWTDGNATFVLSGFSYSSTAVTPSLWYELCTQMTTPDPTTCYGYLDSGLRCCSQAVNKSFDGLNFFTSSGTYTFDWVLYGIVK